MFRFSLTKDALEEIELVLVPKYDLGFDKPVDRECYACYRQECDERLQKILFIAERMDKIVENSSCTATDSEVLKFVSLYIVICGQHSSPNCWTTDTSPQISKKLLEILIAKSEFSTLSTLLINNSEKVLKNILKLFRPHLLKQTWKCYPADVACYAWIIQKIEMPVMGEHINSILPTALIITDDFEKKNKLLGLHCLYHIIRNLTKTDLCYYNQDEVIIDALKPILYLNEVENISPLLSVYQALIEKLHHQLPYSELKRNKFDNIIEVILNSMFMEQRIACREEYIKNISKIILVHGFSMVRHLQMFFKVIEEYALEPTTSYFALEALLAYTKVCWPNMDSLFDKTMRILLKLMYNFSQTDSKYSADTISEAEHLVNILQKLCQKEMEGLCSSIKERCTNDEKFNCIFKRFLTVTKET